MQPDETFEHGDGLGDGEFVLDEGTLLLMQLEQERTNDNQDLWFRQYGFEHECRCAADAAAGDTTEIPVCYANAADRAFDTLLKARAALYAIATADTNDAYALKALAHEVYFRRGNPA